MDEYLNEKEKQAVEKLLKGIEDHAHQIKTYVRAKGVAFPTIRQHLYAIIEDSVTVLGEVPDYY